MDTVTFPSPWILDIYILGTVILCLSFIFICFTYLCMYQVYNDKKMKVSRKEILLQRTLFCVLMADLFDVLFHIIPPTPTGSAICMIQSIGVVGSDVSVFFFSLLLALNVYLLITGRDVEFLLKSFWLEVFIFLSFPVLCMILVPVFNISHNIGLYNAEGLDLVICAS